MGCILRHTRRLSQGRAGCAVGLASHGWHGNGRARHGGVLDLPLRGHGLDLSVELDALVGERRLRCQLPGFNVSFLFLMQSHV